MSLTLYQDVLLELSYPIFFQDLLQDITLIYGNLSRLSVLILIEITFISCTTSFSHMMIVRKTLVLLFWVISQQFKTMIKICD